VEDQQKWQRASAAAFQTYRLLSGDARDALNALISSIMQLKQELFELALVAGGGDICRTCGGQCCLNGKYHVTVLDLLAYRAAGVEPVQPDFGKRPLCPYGGGEGCLMEPRFRSLTCLLFNCELLEERMDTESKQRFATVEQELRRAVTQADTLLGCRAGRALLLSCE